jgi:16S rRNA G966 N2-methylase RsmD
MNRPAIVQQVFDFAIREINALETRIVQAEDDADAMLWEQAAQVVAQFEADPNLTVRQLAAQWINIRNKNRPYSHVHVVYTRQVFGKHAYQNPRPRFREVYNVVAHASTRKDQEDENRAQLDEQVEIEASGIYHGDFRDRYRDVIPPESVQLVLTDPPYDEESIDVYAAAAEAANYVLRPGGSLLAYSGQKHIGDVIAAMSIHLRYWWFFTVQQTGPGHLLQRLGVRSFCKPVLWFVKETRGNVSAILPDVIPGSGREKDLHAWQQGESEAAFLIEEFTNPGDLVVDFCAGSGTVLAAAKSLGRRFTGFETRADHVATIANRLALIGEAP